MTITFIANIRISIKDIANIAQFLDANKIFVETKSKVASEGIKILSARLPDKYKVKDHSDALNVLENLGYNKVQQDSSKYQASLMNAIKIEKSAKSIDKIIQEKIKEMKEEKIWLSPNG